ncbi:MAG: hypothetical protein WBX38_01010, partial [Candidatus Sulfotelmatobacter sp.]
LDGSEPWPTMPIFGIRLWDADVAWAQLNTASGVYDWTTLDEWTAAASTNSVQLMYTFGQTPAWASSDPKDESCDYSAGSCWPPDDLNSDGTGTDQHWIDFVSAIAQHAPSILYWEMWNTPHDPNQWNGTDAQLVRMVQDARTYIKKYIPGATIISPANGQLNYSYPSGNCVMPDLMAGYLAAGLGQYIDVLAFHTYYTTVPEDVIPVVQCYQSTMATYNISSLPLWSTEGAWGTDSELSGATNQAGFLARLYLLLWSNGVARHYWYAWDDATTGTLEVNGKINTPGIAYTQVENWMSGRTMSTLCSENSSDIWTCGLTGANGYEAQAVWYAGGSKSYTVPSQYVNYLDLSGVQHTISKSTVTAGDEPILLQNMSTTASPNFVFSESTPFPEVKAGTTGTSGTLTISAENGFTGTVTLSCPETFGVGSCSITPATVKTFPATATLVINGTSFSAGDYQLAIQGTSGSITNTFDVGFNVGDFSVTGPATLSASPGSKATANVTVTSLDSYSGQVDAACSVTALSGATCALSPANPITIGIGDAVPVTATINVPSGAATGNYNISVSVEDVGGAPSHSLTSALSVATTVNDFSISSITPLTQNVAAGQSASYNFNVAPVGASFTSAVALSCTGLPAGATCSFTPNPVTPGTASAAVVATIATTSASAPGTYPVVVTGASGSLSHSATASLVVPQTIQLTATQPFSGAADVGSQQSATVSLAANYAGSVTPTCSANALAGQCSVTPSGAVSTAAGASTALTLTVTVPSTAAPNPSNPYNVVLTAAGSSGTPTQTLSLPLTVIQDFSLSALSPVSQTVNPGQSSTYNFSVLPIGTFSGAVTFSCSGGPAISQCSFNPSSVTPGSNPATVTLTVSTTATSASLVPARPGIFPAKGRSAFLLACWLGLPGIGLIVIKAGGERRRKSFLAISVAGIFLLTLLLASCGGGGGTNSTLNNGQQSGTQPGTYTIKVTGASGTLSHPASAATLVVNQ